MINIFPTPESLDLLNHLKESSIYIEAIKHELDKRRLKAEELTQKLSLEQKNWVDEQWSELLKINQNKS